MESNIKTKELTATLTRFIVGIGASAGGLEAIHELFDNMPEDTGFSFIIVQHLSPDYKSLMPELLSKHTAMQIFEAQEGMVLKPNCIYVIPSKKIMTVSNGKLRLTEKVISHLPNTAIDSFFKSLANEYHKQAIGIILSGTGTDGTRGIEFIKSAGGIVVVQEPLSAKFDGMPNSAIATGHADLILPPEMMADELCEFLTEAPLLKSFNDLDRKDEEVIRNILEIVKTITSYDFHYYKRPTITRRLSKRMTLKSITNLQEYLVYLKDNAEEARLLCKEFLIGVTKFFRDTEAFDELENTVLPALFSENPQTDVFKVWVTACSSGEEAYSIAILFCEFIQKIKRPDVTIKIFATDIDHAALETASRGLYPETILKDLSSERVENFFTREGTKFKIVPSIRKMVVFAQHDILKDPPFSKLDLITCRNMLIYMSPELQKNVLKTFHFGINANGFLMLGPSENIGILKDSTKEINRKWKIFKNIIKDKRLDHEPFSSPVDPISISFGKSARPKNALANLSEIFKQVIIEEDNYAGVYIDKDFEVKQAIGNFKKFLNFPQDNFNFNLLKLVSADLAMILNTSLRKAIKNNEKVILTGVKVREPDNTVRKISVIIKPFLNQSDYLQAFLFVVFKDDDRPSPLPLQPPGNNVEQSLNQDKFNELESELKEAKANLQAVVEELETSNEELQSSNEEMISANEELQSTNEELQSLNEELHTVNAEHQLKIKELIELNDDMNNYFRSSEVAQMLIDRKLLIRKFTPATKKQINLIETDIGRSITDISNNFQDLDFVNALKQVLKSSDLVEKEVRLSNGRLYQMRISPYIRQDKSVGGVVVTFIDITEIKRLSSMLGAVFNSSPNGISALKAIRNGNNKIIDFEWIASNFASEEILKAKRNSLLGKRLLKEFPSVKKNFFTRFVKVVENDASLRTEHRQVSSGLWFDVIAIKMQDGLVITFSDITSKKHSSDLLQKGFEDLKITSDKLSTTNNELERSNFDLLQFASVASHDLKEPLRKIQTYGNLLHSKLGQKLQETEKNYLDKIIRSSNRMQILIDDVLTFSKLSNKNLQYAETDLNTVINRIVEDLEIIVKEKEVKFKVDAMPKIEAIPGQMNQLFQNLISNAIKFNDEKTPKIIIGRRQITQEEEEALHIKAENYLSITVEDNGIGFDEKYKDKIFGIFQRLHPSASYQGTGIGLAICKKIVDSHCGFIRAESEIDKGARFIIILPLKWMGNN